MKRSTGLWVLGAALAAGCGSSDDGGSSPTNKAPTISALAVDREAVVTSGVVTVTVEATDPDGDKLEFAWVADVGQLSATSGEGPLIWTAPGERGVGTISVTVSDGKGGSAEESVTVDVLGWVQSPQTGSLPTGLPFKDVAFASPEEGWIVGGAENINVPYLFHFVGGQWVEETQDPSGHMHAVVPLAADNVWVTGGMGQSYHWDGAAWTKFKIPGGCVHGMDFLNPSDGWVTPAEGQPYMRRYTGGGLTEWTQFPITTPGNQSVSMVSDKDGWAVGNGGRITRFDGQSWSAQTSPVTTDLYHVHMIAADNGWAVGTAGTVLHYDGTAWTLIDAGAPTVILRAVDAFDAENVWMVGSGGTILYWNGTGLMQVPSPVTSELQAVYLNGADDGWIVGLDTTILHFE